MIQPAPRVIYFMSNEVITANTALNPLPPGSGQSRLPPTQKNVAKTEKGDNPAKLCENCGFDLDGPFCGRCGQPERSVIRFFGSVVMHILDDIFGFDSRAGRTLVPLIFRPGFLTNEYFRGRRVHYVPPIRLYFFVSIIFFIFLGFFTDDSVNELKQFQQSNTDSISVISKDINSLKAKMAAKDYVVVVDDQTTLDKLLIDRKETRAELEENIKEIQENLDEIEGKQRQPGYELDTGEAIQKQALLSAISMIEMNLDEDPKLAAIHKVERKLERLEHKQSLPGYKPKEKDELKKQAFELKIAQLLSGKLEVDGTEETDESSSGSDDSNFEWNLNPQFDFLSDEHNKKLEGFFGELEAKAKVAFMQDAGPLVKQTLGLLPQMMFVLLPLFALLLKVFFVFSKRFYMEHLTVALHSHAFMFVVLMMVAMLSTLYENIYQAYPDAGSVIENIIIALGLWVPAYLLIMQKKVYKQGYIFTFVKFCMIGITYIMLLSFTAMVAFFWGLAQL
jgi:hypothetical protein